MYVSACVRVYVCVRLRLLNAGFAVQLLQGAYPNEPSSTRYIPSEGTDLVTFSLDF